MVIDETDLVDWFKRESTLSDYSSGDAAAITRAISRASKQLIAALRRCGRYTQEAIDALSPLTTPEDVKGFACAIAADELTKSDAARPASIDTAAAEARKQVSWIATGNYIVDGITKTKRKRVRGASPKRLAFGDDDHECLN
jgi:hypothetical protein